MHSLPPERKGEDEDEDEDEGGGGEGEGRGVRVRVREGGGVKVKGGWEGEGWSKALWEQGGCTCSPSASVTTAEGNASSNVK